MLAAQSAHIIQESTVIEMINYNLEACWLNWSKHLWNVLMCPFVLHAMIMSLISIMVWDQHKKIIESSHYTAQSTNPNLD